MRRTIGRGLNRLLKPLGYRLERVSPRADDLTTSLTLEAALARVSGRGLPVQTIIDVGASNGQWLRVARQAYPRAYGLLVEANRIHAADLQRARQELGNLDYVLAAAGDTVGEIYFDAADPFGGLASHTPLDVPTIRVPVTTIDTLVAERRPPPPYLLKLDTHGFEVPILEGARQTLQQTNLLIIETYNFQIQPDSLKFHQMCQRLNEWGFATIDLCDPLFRARDLALWQFDLFFIPANRPEFQSNGFN